MRISCFFFESHWLKIVNTSQFVIIGARSVHIDEMANDKSLVVFEDDPEVVQEMRKRQAEAEELERKLKIIQETVPTRIFNVCGSSAGAGSGDFHQYRMIRRREQARLKRIEEEAAEAEEIERKQKKYSLLKDIDDRKTEKKRQKRMKEKMRKKAKKGKDENPTLDNKPEAATKDEKNPVDLPQQVELD